MVKSNDIEKIYHLAKEVLLLSRNTLLVNLRFLDMALSQFQYLSNPMISSIGTEGGHIIYNPKALLLKYKEEREEVTRCYLHMVFHCVFRHMYIHSLVDQEKWNLACDIAVETIINELNIRSVNTKRSVDQNKVINELKSKVKYLTAEKIYNYFLNNPISELIINQWSELFVQDDHFLWYLSNDEQEKITGSGENGNESSDENNSGEENDTQGTSSYSAATAEQQWKEISKRMQQNLETFSKERGDTAGNLMQNLKALNREKYNYESFLKKFSVMGERMKINDDEFDYVFYTYGLSLYKNMPLVEPLEYKEIKAIKEFVIVIDTSGSVYGEQVQSFINKTYNIMKNTESFFSKINVHIIQCDTKIQEDAKITNQEEFDAYIQTMQLKGFGGTDFRPAFDYVDQMRKNHEFSNLKGLIYFTDGYGIFPTKKPDYETAFVFVRDNYEIPKVPSWAIKLVLEPGDLS